MHSLSLVMKENALLVPDLTPCERTMPYVNVDDEIVDDFSNTNHPVQGRSHWT